VPIADDAEQTRNVMGAHARRVSLDPPPVPDLDAFLDLQRWLAGAGTHRVIVPFADILAELVPAAAVRMRRDFRQLLTAVQAHALLYQLQRSRSPSGAAIVATVADYAAVHALLAPLFQAIVAEGVTPVVRVTVEAIGADETHVSVADLAVRLGVSKATVSYRVGQALAWRWLINDETRKGRPAQLRQGLPLPAIEDALPPAGQVEALFECSNGFREKDTPPPPGDGNGPEREPGCDDVEADEEWEEGEL
jgi:hypothetical protein